MAALAVPEFPAAEVVCTFAGPLDLADSFAILDALRDPPLSDLGKSFII